MEQYISKSALVAEIERLIKKNELYLDDNVSVEVRYQKTGAYSVLCDIRHFIDNLETKEVNLMKEIADIYEANYEEYLTYEEFADIAKHFFELGLKVQKGEEDVNSPEEECTIVYKNITMIDKDGNTINAKIEQREKV